MITIIDYKMGNVGSVVNMLHKLGQKSILTSDKGKISKATKLILPGVGAFDNGMDNLKKFDLIKLLNELVKKKKIPVLGICLGMQLMGKKSEEGKLKGLGWIDATVVKFHFKENQNLRIPHMGWNTVSVSKKSKLFHAMLPKPRFYFVHSYYLACRRDTDILTKTTYGLLFTSSIEVDNIYGTQFHPEKSHKFGKQLLKNFVELPC